MARTTAPRKVALISGGCLLLTLSMIATLNRDRILEWYGVWRALGKDFDSEGRNAQGYREYRHRGTGIVFVLLRGGTFWMGSPDDQGSEDERPRHRVTLSPFLIAKYELTQEDWLRLMGTSPSHFQGDRRRPVESISWEDCREFCERTALALRRRPSGSSPAAADRMASTAARGEPPRDSTSSAGIERTAAGPRTRSAGRSRTPPVSTTCTGTCGSSAPMSTSSLSIRRPRLRRRTRDAPPARTRW
jgi:formylglycine-generating enzyme required for sulfatase activity